MLNIQKAKKAYIFLACILIAFWANSSAFAQSLGDPLVKITFGSGTADRAGPLAADSGSTTYTYSGSGQIAENVYTITNQVNTNVHGGFVTSTDHTGNPGGYMMVVNGNLTAGTVYTRTVTGLCGNTQYQFGVWIKNVLANGGILPNMVFHILKADGVTELVTPVTTGDVPNGNVWHNYTANFTLPAGTQTLIIKLVSNASGEQGNDFAVDDISFSPYGSTVSAAFDNSTTTTETTCSGSSQIYHINATSTLASGYVQKLQMYINGAWVDQSAGGTATSWAVTAPAAAGTYHYRLVSSITDNIASANCVVASNNLTITVTPSPVAAFTYPNATCLGSSTQFTDASVTNGSTITSWAWDFGDGLTSALQNPTHTYSATGTYIAKLTVASISGCAPTTISHSITISALPVAAFIFTTPNCLGNMVGITDQSTTGTGTINSWTWNYGDGTTEIKTTNAPFQHMYTDAGTYTVTLTITNTGGCTGTTTNNIILSPLPVAAFTTPDVCLADASATFTNISTIDDNNTAGLTYLWNFGDANATNANPNTSTQKNPSHKYTLAAIYQVSLTVTSASGCSSTVTESFTVNGSVPVASFTVDDPAIFCSDLPVEFSNTSTVDFGSITKLEWYFDYGNNATEVETDNNPEFGKLYFHYYPKFYTPATKNYQVRLVVYSGGTCISEDNQTISLLAVPQLSFTAPSSVCITSGTLQLNAHETAGPAGTGVYSGTGVSTTGLFDPVLAGIGTFTITYTYTANICPVSISQTITVNPVPAVTVGPDITVLSGGSSKLPATVSQSGLTYLWTPSAYLDDPTLLNPNVTPLQDANYTLTVTNAEGCSVSGQIAVSVLQGPVVPNTFTPNGDGINDLWDIKYLNTYTDCTVQIFNRYGARLFSSIGYNVPWDGNYNGSAVPSGVYYYIINPKHGRSSLSGSLTIIR